MRFLWNAAEKDLRRHLRDPLALALWLGIPLLVGGLISLVMGGADRPPPTAHLLVADEDGGTLSGLLVWAFGQDRQGQFLRVEQVERAAGYARIASNDGTALLVIPEGFGNAVLNEKPTKLLLVTNPSQQILPRIVREGLEMLVDGSFYVHRVIGPELREIVAGPQDEPTFSNDTIARVSVEINKTIERVNRYLFPPVIDVKTSVDQQKSGEQVSMVKLFVPGILFMALIFMAEGLSADVWRERDQGTLRRSACTPSSVAILLSGKLLASAIVILASTLLVLAAGMIYLNMPLARLPLALVWAAFSGVSFLLVFVLIQLHATSQRAGTVLTNSVVMPLLFIGGSFFPFEAMPDWMAAIGRWTPNGWALEHLKDILFGRAVAGSLSVAFIALLALAALLFLLSERRMRRVFARS
jgi:ABC-2 type transport system permease protein